VHNYLDFLHYGQKFAINGRYLIPIAIPIALLLALAYRQFLINKHLTKSIAVIAVILVFLQGGGVLTYLVYSNKYWYWPNKTITAVNTQTQSIIKPLIIIKEPIATLKI